MSTAQLAIPKRLGPRCNGMSMTRAEFWEHDDWTPGYRYELVRNVLVVNPRPDIGERVANDALSHWLRTYRDCHENGWTLDETLPWHLIDSEDCQRIVDRAIWTGCGAALDPIVDVPTIVIDIVSRRNRDRQRDYIEKRDEYRAIGVREYWVIDRFRRCLTVCTETDEQTIDSDGIHTTPLLPGFELSVSRILAIADRYAPPRRRRRR